MERSVQSFIFQLYHILLILIAAPPSFEEREVSVRAERGEVGVQLSCHARGDPVIQYTWTRDDTFIHGYNDLTLLHGYILSYLESPSL